MAAAASTASAKSGRERERPSDPAAKEFKDVFQVELQSINSRRGQLRKSFPDYKNPDFPSDIDTGPNRRVIDAVGLALSGGGIRSASFCLGVLQALNATRRRPDTSGKSSEAKKDAAASANNQPGPSLIDRIDYLSTVSGGGYIGCSLAVGLSKRGGHFPFDSKLEEDEPRSVRHIRDFSNYLNPDGIFDFFRNATVYIRGLVTNVIIVLPFVLFPAALTVWLNHAKNDLAVHLFVKSPLNIFKFETFILTKYIFIFLLILFALWALLLSAHDRASRSPFWRLVFKIVHAVVAMFAWIGRQVARIWRGLRNLFRKLARIWHGIRGWFGKQFKRFMREKKEIKVAKKTAKVAKPSKLSQSLQKAALKVLGLFGLVKSQTEFREAASPRTIVLACGIILLVFVAFCEWQPIVLSWLVDMHTSNPSVTTYGTAVVLVAIAAAAAILAQRIALLLKQISGESNFGIRLAGAVSVVGLYLAGAALPLLIWVIYLTLCLWGISDSGFHEPQWLGVLSTKLDGWMEIFFVFIGRKVKESMESEFLYLGYIVDKFSNADVSIRMAEFKLQLSSLLDWLGGALGDFAHWKPIGSFYLVASVVVGLLACVLSPNSNSLHRLYRDRLSKAFIFYEPKETSWLGTIFHRIASFFMATRKISPVTETQKDELATRAEQEDLPAQDSFKLSELSDEFTPYVLINSAVNIQASKHANQRGRNADFFVFSPNYIGSAATKYASTKSIESYDNDVDVATAMAISGAAASANMGGGTIKALTPTLTILNVRLGYWLRNPGWVKTASSWQEFITRLFEATNFYFFLELFGRLKEDSRYIYVTDGGHIENLGVYELLRRRCRLIIAVDAEADSHMNFGSFVKLQRHARIDLGTRIELPWRSVRAASLAAKEAVKDGKEIDPDVQRKGPHCAIGIIEYPNEEKGYLIYVKSSITCDENDIMLDYKRRNPEYPHKSTSDQFFTEEQFEVYRALGFHAVYRLFNAPNGDVDNASVYSPVSDAGTFTNIFANDPNLNEIRRILDIP